MQLHHALCAHTVTGGSLHANRHFHNLSPGLGTWTHASGVWMNAGALGNHVSSTRPMMAVLYRLLRNTAKSIHTIADRNILVQCTRRRHMSGRQAQVCLYHTSRLPNIRVAVLPHVHRCICLTTKMLAGAGHGSHRKLWIPVVKTCSATPSPGMTAANGAPRGYTRAGRFLKLARTCRPSAAAGGLVL